MEQKYLYVVYIETGEYDDYFKYIHFVTDNKIKANNWVNKYNKLIKEQDEKIQNNPTLDYFMKSCIDYDNPMASVMQIEFRKF